MRNLLISEDFAEEFVATMLRDSIDTVTTELNSEGYHHPEDIKYCKKMKKALIKVLAYYSTSPVSI